MTSDSLRACMVVAVLVAVAAGRAPAQDDRTLTSAACHVSFRYPADWIVRPDTTVYPDAACAFEIRAAQWDSLLVEADSVSGAYTIWLAVMPGTLDSAALVAGFERRDSAWVAFGRQGLELPADAVAGPTWRGVRATTVVGCHRLGGGYVGLCEIPKALVSDGARAVVLEGGPASDDAFERILRTLELRR